MWQSLSLRCIKFQKMGILRNFLFELKDRRLIESVLISHKNRHTLCVSSQIGCLIGCDFCATATMTYERNLSISEILLQYYYVQKHLLQRGEKLGNVVYMGMGEPFLNYDAVHWFN